MASTLAPPTRPPVAVSAPVLAAGLVAAFALFNVAYVFAGPLDLAPDEAHYWDWSRRPLQWSYYSKGPLVAVLIRGGCALLGDTVAGVRLPAVLCNVLLLAGVYQLARQTFQGERFAFLVVALALTVPPLAAPAVLMTIDGPFLACWAWACVFGQRAVTGGSWKAWVAAGAVTAVGVLAKQTMLLFPACVGLFLITRPRAWPRFALLCGVSALGLVPLVLWNAANDWVSVRHVFTQAAAPQKAAFDAWSLPMFLAGQFGILLGYWFVAWVAAVVAYAPWRHREPHTAFLWCVSVPVWVLFALAAVKSHGQPNWPVAAYVPGVVLAVAWVLRQLASPSPRYQRFARGALAAAIALGVLLTVFARWPGTFRPVLAEVTPPPSTSNPVPIRKLDPTCRLEGWRVLAAKVDELRDAIIAEEGQEPIIATMTWAMPGELAFHCRGHPEVYTLGVALTDRHSQYDLWRPNPLADAQAFRGRTFVYVGEVSKELLQAFDRADPPVEVIASDGGIPVADWKVRVLRGFRGLPEGRRAAGY